ncbi:flavoprotein [Actinokineospora diospyrosa]|uniref:DisD n=1 Tax=Actinokineospora diospyrosa TaxID=103728 RepID=A0A8G1A4V4_9PSEU|nr:flavoprotein [Actinokineospora diospyrosa]MCP2271566.1 Flavoprotein [Actinokineospora diospyrosa]QYZ85381.1 DisD [Actinokineospora diospyrosa]
MPTPPAQPTHPNPPPTHSSPPAQPAHANPPTHPSPLTPPRKLLLGVSGSVAALGLPGYLYAFRAAGVSEIIAVVTTSALQFLPVTGLAALCDRVCTDGDSSLGHVALARWAEHTLVLPATAHLLGCLANGLAPSLLATTLLAVDGPVTLAPAMNAAMWRRPAVRRNVATLRADGHQVIDPVPGAVYEVASRAVVAGIAVPPPAVVLERISA